MTSAWGDDSATEALLRGQVSSGNAAFDDVLAQMRLAGTIGVPAPRADVEEIIRTGWNEPVRATHRWRMVAAALAATLLMAVTATAAASETVQDPLQDTIVKVVNLFRHHTKDGSRTERPRRGQISTSAAPSTDRPTSRAGHHHPSLVAQLPRTRHGDDADAGGQGDAQTDVDGQHSDAPDDRPDDRQDDRQDDQQDARQDPRQDFAKRPSPDAQSDDGGQDGDAQRDDDRSRGDGRSERG